MFCIKGLGCVVGVTVLRAGNCQGVVYRPDGETNRACGPLEEESKYTADDSAPCVPLWVAARS